MSEATAQIAVLSKPASRVTIRHNQQLAKGESRLENLLRQLTEVSRLLVIARWRKEVGTRSFARSLTDVPVDEAARVIAERYQLDYARNEQALRFRPKLPARSSAR
jgi:hypothetical protein